MNKNAKVSLILNILIAISGSIGLILSVKLGAYMFAYFTILSNTLAVITSILYVINLLVKKNQSEIPYYVIVLRFMSSVCLLVTILTVFTILAATIADNYINGLIYLLTTDGMFFHHLVCPVLSIVSFVFFEGDRRLNKKKTIYLGMLPFILYAIVTITLNITHTLDGPYPFLQVYERPVYASIITGVVMFVATYFLTRFLLLENQKHAPRIKRDTFKKA